MSYGFGNWGVRTVGRVDNRPVGRPGPRTGQLVGRGCVPGRAATRALYAEASNTETGRASLDEAIEDRPTSPDR